MLTAEDDWMPNEPTLRFIQNIVKGFSDYEEWERLLREAEQELTASKETREA